MARESATARQLIDRLCELRDRRGWMHKELAENLDVTPATLSKRMGDLITVPDDEWIARLARIANLSEDDTARLLVNASIERNSDSEFNDVLLPALARIKNVYLSETKLPRPKNDTQILIEAFQAIGIAVSERDIKQFATGSDHAPLSDAAFSTMLKLYTAISTKAATNDEVSKFGHFTEELRVRLGVREFSMAKTPPERWPSAIPGATVHSLPLLPGILVHHITVPAKTKVPPHSHDGMEAVFPLSGRMHMKFEGRYTVSLDADKPKVLLYEASLKHEGETETDAAVVVVNYSPRLARRWDKVEKLYREQLQQDEALLQSTS